MSSYEVSKISFADCRQTFPGTGVDGTALRFCKVVQLSRNELVCTFCDVDTTCMGISRRMSRAVFTKDEHSFAVVERESPTSDPGPCKIYLIKMGQLMRTKICYGTLYRSLNKLLYLYLQDHQLAMRRGSLLLLLRMSYSHCFVVWNKVHYGRWEYKFTILAYTSRI